MNKILQKLINGNWLLVCILIIATLFRFWDLSDNPPGLTWDEAALGYNAYSLLLTGKDEYGTPLPFNLKSFGDYKPAVYAYILIPFVGVLGLNEFSVRLPSAIFGVITVLVIYLFTNELFKNRLLALLAAFSLAVSPWAIQFSRPAFEANMALMLNTTGIYLFLLGLRRRKILIYSALVFGISLLTYQASRLFVPVILIFLLALYLKRIEFKRSYFIIWLFTVGLFLLTFLGITFLTGQNNRLSALNFFAYKRSDNVITQIEKEDGLPKQSVQFQLLHGEWWTYTRGLLERYLMYFSPKMLFVDGDYNQRHRVPDLGLLYYFSVISIPLGVLYFIRQKKGLVVFLWLLLSLIPAVLSRDLISSVRALNMVIPLSIIEAAGALMVINWIHNFNKVLKFSLSFLIALLVFFNILIYLDRYFIHSPKEYSESWLYGYKTLFTNKDLFNKEKLSKYNEIIITDTFGQPYIFYLFYTKYPPQSYQKEALLDQPTWDVGSVKEIGNIRFRHINWPTDRGLKNTLFIGTEIELPDQDILPFEEYRKLGEIKSLNGRTSLKLIESY